MTEGRAARQDCPRSSQAETANASNDRDPVELIIASSEGRLPELLPVRYSRMLESPFAFFRGSAVVQAHDLAKTPRSGIMVQACGDCHLANFGGFATPERNLVFDINDFDETAVAPWEWDVKRLGASLVLAARWRKFSPEIAAAAVAAAASSYRETMAASADVPTLATWYAQITLAEIEQELRDRPKLAKQLKVQVKRAQHNTAEHIFHKLTAKRDGKLRIIDRPPLLFHQKGVDTKAEAEAFLEIYRKSLRDEYQALLSRFTLVDAALKVVGVGSVGTRCYVMLLLGPHNDPLFLQLKEAGQSVLECYAGASTYNNHGQRVVAGQRLMQAASDIFLGWSRGPNERDFYVRQLRDMKIAVDITALDDKGLVSYAGLCGRALARAHAKGGAAPRIAGYLGSSTAFDDAIGQYASAYADQVKKDYAAFREAASAGRIPTETAGNSISDLAR